MILMIAMPKLPHSVLWGFPATPAIEFENSPEPFFKTEDGVTANPKEISSVIFSVRDENN